MTRKAHKVHPTANHSRIQPLSLSLMTSRRVNSRNPNLYIDGGPNISKHSLGYNTTLTPRKPAVSIQNVTCTSSIYLSPLIYSKWQYPKLQSRLFLQHEKTTRHTRQSRQVVSKGQKPFQLPAAPDLADDAIWTRIHCDWWLAKEDVAICKFPSYLEATLVDKGLQPPMTYKDEKFAWELVELIDKHFRKELQHRIRKSPYFGVMADETTDNSADQ